MLCLNAEDSVLKGVIKMDDLKFIHFSSPLSVNDSPCKVKLKRNLMISPLSHGLSCLF